MRWPQLVALGVCALVVMVSGIWLVDPGRVTITVAAPSYDDNTGTLTGAATTETVDVACPPLFGSLESSNEAAMRELMQRLPGTEFARQYEDARSAACSARDRGRAVVGGIGVVAGVVAAAVLVWGLRRRGAPVFVAKEKVVVPVDGVDPPIVVCRLCGRPRIAARATLATALDGSASLCRSCLAEHQAHIWLVLLAGSAYSFVAGVTIAVAGSPDVAALAIGFGLLVPLLSAQIVPHELGHAVVGRLTGFKVFQITVGIGLRVFVRRIGRTVLVVRAVPAGGLTSLNTTSRSLYRFRLWLSVAAGPAVSALIFAVAFRWQPAPDGVAAAVRTAVLVTSGWLLVTNLLPRHRPGVYASMSDGWQLITIPRLPASEIEQRMLQHQALDAIAVRQQVGGDLDLAADVRSRLQAAAAGGDRKTALVALAVLLADHDWPGAVRLARETLATMNPGDPEYPTMANALAWSLLVSDDPTGAEADHNSDVAYRLDASGPVAGTRGSVLIELGRIDEGIPLVARSLAESADDTSSALNLCYLAIGEIGRGDSIRARASLAAAARLDPQCPLLDRARTRLATAGALNETDEIGEREP